MRAKTVGWVVGALASATVLWEPVTALAYCPGWDKSAPNYNPNYYSVSHEFNRADHVIEVRVLRETWLGEDGKPKRLEPPFQNGAKKPWGFDPYAGAYYDVEVLKSFKGTAPKHLRLFSENSTARFWFDVGSEQVLFVSEGTFEPPIGRELSVDTCGNSRSLSKAAGLLRQLNRLSASRQR